MFRANSGKRFKEEIEERKLFLEHHEIIIIFSSDSFVITAQRDDQPISILNKSFVENRSTQKHSSPHFLTVGYLQFFTHAGSAFALNKPPYRSKDIR